MTQNESVSKLCHVTTPDKPCDCGGPWIRETSPQYPFSFPVCGECKSNPRSYEFRRSIDGHRQEIRHNSKGDRLRSLDELYKTALEVETDIYMGTFEKSRYKRRIGMVSISDTIEDFIREHIFPRWKRLHMTMDDKIWVEDYMQPFMADVGVFAVSKVHLWDFIRTFNFRGEDRERAERLFEVITNEIRI